MTKSTSLRVESIELAPYREIHCHSTPRGVRTGTLTTDSLNPYARQSVTLQSTIRVIESHTAEAGAGIKGLGNISRFSPFSEAPEA